MKIIYHAITTYHLMELWVHSLLNYNADIDNLVLVYDDVLEEKFPNIQSIPAFNDFYPIPYRKSPRDFEKIDNWIDEIFDPVNSDSFDEIYVAGAQFYYSQYLIKHRLSFVFFEEASGRLSKPEVVMENDKVLNICRYEIAKNNGMYDGTNDFVKERIGNKKAQLETYKNSFTNFDLVENLSKLDKDSIDSILNFFNAPVDFHIEENSAVVLTQHFTNLRMMSMEQQIELYQNTLDFYLDGRDIIIKLHPDDQVNYSECIPECRIIKTKFPSELLPFVFDSDLKMIATISSTGIYSYKDICDELLYFDVQYEKNYLLNYSIYVSLCCAKQLYPSNARFCYLGDNYSQVNNMFKYGDISNDFSLDYNAEELSSCDAIVIDSFDDIYRFDLSLEEYKDKVVFVLCPDMYSVIEDKKFIRYLTDNLVIKPIYILINGKLYIHLTGVIKGDRKMEILHLQCEKQLKQSGGKMWVEEEKEIENELFITKGILKATENRLNYYINKAEKNDDK